VTEIGQPILLCACESNKAIITDPLGNSSIDLFNEIAYVVTPWNLVLRPVLAYCNSPK
jgi:hypothetical protein